MRFSLLYGALLALAAAVASATPITHGSPQATSTESALRRRHQMLVESGCDHAQVRRRLEDRAARQHQAQQESVLMTGLDRRQGGSYNEGGQVGPSGGAAAANYKCDPSKCKLPDCLCASTTPPGNLDIKDVPMFITLTRYVAQELEPFTLSPHPPCACYD